MVLLIAIVVLTAIVVFFSSEFGHVIKKIMARKGVKLILPLFLVSLLIINHETRFLTLLLHFKISLHKAVYWLAYLVPIHGREQAIATFSLIYLITLIPMTLLFFQKKKSPFFYQNTFWILTAFIWLLLMITLTVGFY